MELLFCNETIGVIKDIYRENNWLHGNFIANNAYYKYKKFLDAMTCEDGMDESEYDKELLNENNWFVADKDCVKGIWIPAIYEDGDISIRLR